MRLDVRDLAVSLVLFVMLTISSSFAENTDSFFPVLTLKSQPPCQGPYQDRRISAETLTHILDAHLKWLADRQDPQGRRANLCRSDLTKMDLREMNLSGAQFNSATLRQTNLSGTSLVKADFRNADLTQATLYVADLTFGKPILFMQKWKELIFEKPS